MRATRAASKRRGQSRDLPKECLGGIAHFAENPDVAAPSSDLDKIHALSGWRALVLWPLGLAIRLWCLTLRLEASESERAVLEKRDQPVAIVLWHNRLFLIAEYFRRFRHHRPTYGLVSASTDGAWLAAFFTLFGIRSVRGSSSQRGREAALALINVLKAGHDIGITPDGPRGPMYEFKPGGLIVTRRARAPILLVGFELEAAWQLRSWDRFRLPHPFSRVRVRGEVVPVTVQTGGNAPEEIRARLLALNPDRPTERAIVI